MRLSHRTTLDTLSRHMRISRSATPAAGNHVTTSLETSQNERFCGFPRWHGAFRRRFPSIFNTSQMLDCHEVPRLPNKTTLRPLLKARKWAFPAKPPWIFITPHTVWDTTVCHVLSGLSFPLVASSVSYSLYQEQSSNLAVAFWQQRPRRKEHRKHSSSHSNSDTPAASYLISFLPSMFSGLPVTLLSFGGSLPTGSSG